MRSLHRLPFRIVAIAAFAACAFAVPARAQTPSAAPSSGVGAPAMPMHRASPMAAQRIAITPALLGGLPRTSVTVAEEHGGTATYAGVPLSAILAHANVPQGKDLRGPMLAQIAVAVATDGYRVAFAFPELDPAFTDRVILLADRRNGVPLDAAAGPYRIVVPGEKREARWIRSVVEIDIETAP